MMVMMMAMTPSLKASSLLLFILGSAMLRSELHVTGKYNESVDRELESGRCDGRRGVAGNPASAPRRSAARPRPAEGTGGDQHHSRARFHGRCDGHPGLVVERGLCA